MVYSSSPKEDVKALTENGVWEGLTKGASELHCGKWWCFEELNLQLEHLHSQVQF